MKSQGSTSTGISTLSVLGIVFVTLKLMGVIHWSWWWVTAPFWGPFVVIIRALSGAGVAYLVMKIFYT